MRRDILQLMQETGLTRRAVDNLDRPEKTLNDAIAYLLALPALRACWPMSSVDYAVASRARDVSGQGYHLTDNNTPLFNYDELAPYAEFDGVNQYLSRVDGGAANWADILGTETYIAAAARGLTLGGWFYIDQTTGADQGFITKVAGGAINTRSYALRYVNATQCANIAVIDAANALFQIDSGSTMSFAAWHYVVGRFDPSTELAIFLDNEKTTNVVAIPAAIIDSTAAVAIGANAIPSVYLDGRASLCFLCAAMLSDEIIMTLFEQTRALFGV